MWDKIPAQFKTPHQIALALFLLLGLYGSAWISDDWDVLRLQAMTYIGMPALVLYYWVMTVYPAYREEHDILFRVHILSLLIVFASGNYLLVNALTAGSDSLRRNVAVQNDKSVVTVATHKGGLGHLFTKRW